MAKFESGHEDSFAGILAELGEDPKREGLVETPRRFINALAEMTEGYAQDPVAILSKTFEGDGYDEIIAVRAIPFSSLCEHHVLPFTGTVDVAYLPGPGGRIVGLSKIPRAVAAITKRLQVQERATSEIASAIEKALNPLGVAVVMRGSHACMKLRGVQSDGEMHTSVMRGVFRDQPQARAEVMRLFEAK